MSYNKGMLERLAMEHGFSIKQIVGVSGITIGYRVSKTFKSSTVAGEFIKKKCGDEDG